MHCVLLGSTKDGGHRDLREVSMKWVLLFLAWATATMAITPADPQFWPVLVYGYKGLMILSAVGCLGLAREEFAEGRERKRRAS